MIARIVIPERLVALAHESGFDGVSESGAWLVCSVSNIEKDPWDQESNITVLVREVIPLSDDDIASAGPTHLTVRTSNLVRILGRNAKAGLVVGFLHGHPGGRISFSSTDDENERNLWQLARNRQRENVPFASVLALPNGEFRGRIWSGPSKPLNAQVRINGSACALYGHAELSQDAEQALDRQARVFGRIFNQAMGSLKVTIVGAGGTGSPLCAMLPKAGVRKLAVIDPDSMELTNLHRNHIAGMSDIGQPKAEVAARFIDRMGLGAHCVPIVSEVSHKQCRDVLKASDVILCATDDHGGRIYLNRFAYVYEIPVIDVGLAVDMNDDGSLRDMTGRTTLLYPGAPCLLCRGVVNIQRAREEQLQRDDPATYESLAREGYVLGHGDPEPAFISMTTSMACMAIEELVQLYSGYRNKSTDTQQRLRRFHVLEERRTGGAPKIDCPICGSDQLWSRGDLRPFLDCV